MRHARAGWRWRFWRRCLAWHRPPPAIRLRRRNPRRRLTWRRPQTTAAKPAPAPPPQSAAAAAPHDQGTLEVTSDRDLEWLQQDHAYVARGHAVAKRGTVTLIGDTLVAYYRPLPGAAAQPKPAASSAGQTGFDSSTTEIWRVVAEGNVHIISEDRDAWGDRAEYDKDKSVVVLTGKALKATTLEDTVTARDSLEYWQDKDMAVARGNAKSRKGQRQHPCRRPDRWPFRQGCARHDYLEDDRVEGKCGGNHDIRYRSWGRGRL